MLNRLGDLQSSTSAGGGISRRGTPSNESIQTDHMSSDTVITLNTTQSIFVPIRKGINNINDASRRINELYNIKRTALPEQQKKALKEVDMITMSMTAVIRDIKTLLDNAQAKQQKSAKAHKERNQGSKHVTDDLWFTNMFNSSVRAYKEAIVSFQESTNTFRGAVEEDFTRQAKIVNPDISQQQIQTMLESSDPAQFLQTQIMAISPELLDEVAELEEEHERVKKLETTVAEIQELFNACAILVAEASEKLNEIEQNVEITLGAAESGKREIQRAEVYTVQTRKTKIKTAVVCFIITAILIMILLNAIGAVDWFKVHK